MTPERICVVGTTHLACIYAAGLAELGAEVVQCDDNAEVIARLVKADPPLFEPGLVEAIQKNQPTGRLTFSSDVAGSVAKATIIYLAEDIRVDNGLPDLSMAHRRFGQIVPNLAPGAVLVVSTQIPVGTMKQYEAEFAPKSKEGRLRLGYHPEFLRLGAALRLFLQPDYIVLGHNDDAAAARVMALFKSIDCPKHLMGLADAEMVKHAANAYVAVSVSFACEMALLADREGVDAFKVGKALRSDKRIGPTAYVLPGLGFTGGNLERDINVWKKKAKEAGVATTLLDATLAVNDAQANVPLKLTAAMLGSLKGKTVAIWGLAYKPDSNSIRGSYAIILAKGLAEAGAKVRGFDPNADPAEVKQTTDIELKDDRYAICEGADALVIMNNAKLYSDCDLARLASTMRGRNILDPHGMLDGDRVIDGGFAYGSVGRGYTIRQPA